MRTYCAACHKETEWEYEIGGGILTESHSQFCKECGTRIVGQIWSGKFLW